MPCYATGSREGDLMLSMRESQEEATKVTDLLCQVCRLAEVDGRPLPAEVAVWWAKHKKIDQEAKDDALPSER